MDVYMYICGMVKTWLITLVAIKGDAPQSVDEGFAYTLERFSIWDRRPYRKYCVLTVDHGTYYTILHIHVQIRYTWWCIDNWKIFKIDLHTESVQVFFAVFWFPAQRTLRWSPPVLCPAIPRPCALGHIIWILTSLDQISQTTPTFGGILMILCPFCCDFCVLQQWSWRAALNAVSDIVINLTTFHGWTTSNIKTASTAELHERVKKVRPASEKSRIAA